MSFLILPLFLTALFAVGFMADASSPDDDDAPDPDAPEEPRGETDGDGPDAEEPDVDEDDAAVLAEALRNLPIGQGGFDDLEITTGSEDDDTLTGTDATDGLIGLGGNDALDGGPGRDVLYGGTGDDLLQGGAGDDVLIDVSGQDTVFGGDGDDLAILTDRDTGAPDRADMGAGNDFVFGDDGDTLTGGPGADVFLLPVEASGQEPVRITDLDLYGETPDRVAFLDADDQLFPRAAFFDGTLAVGIGDMPDGNGAAVYNGSTILAVIEGYDAETLFYDTAWIANFQPESARDLDGDDQIDGTAADDDLVGGAGDDTLTGLGGDDYLDGQEGDDLLIGTDGDTGGPFGDTLVGGEGDDTLRVDAGDRMAGAGGVDSYEIVVPGGDAGPAVLNTYEPGETITLVEADGTPLDAGEAAGLTVIASADGAASLLVFEGQTILRVEGYAPDDLGPLSAWLGNGNAPAPPPAPDGEDEGDEGETDSAVIVIRPPAVTGTPVSVTAAEASGQIANAALFGGNAVYSFNTDDGVPRDSYQAAVAGLDIDFVRFPGGQGDTGILTDGPQSLNIVEMRTGADGALTLRPELTDFLDWARDPDPDSGSDTPKRVTLVIPTIGFTVSEYGDYADEIERFAEAVMRDYGDVIQAFEIGNEYWRMGETAYGQKADIAAPALERGMLNAGVAVADQPDILVQMGSPFSGSEFHSSVDDRGFNTRADDSNRQIIAQLGDEARDAVDGVIEHYYYNKSNLAFTEDTTELRGTDRDLDIWRPAFDKDLEVYITEWNVRTTDAAETGLRAGTVLLQQVEGMVGIGVDAAHAWPVQHNTPTDLAGGKTEPPIIDEGGRVVNSVEGAVFDLMSSSLPGLELVHTAVTGDEGQFELDTWQSDDRTVIYVSSRSLETIDLDLDLSALVPEFVSVSALRVSTDIDSGRSDGVHFVPGKGYQEADSVLVDGQRYYINENDVRAVVTDVAVSDTAPKLTLRPFEVIEITFDTTGSTAPTYPVGSIEEPVAGGEALTRDETAPDRGGIVNTIGGTPGDDRLQGTGDADYILAGPGDDAVRAGNGADHVEGQGGDDTLIGERGDDDMSGDGGDDTLYGYGGDDSLRGGRGSDLLVGNQGDDKLTGQEGADTLRGGTGDDVLDGRFGSDVLIGGPGADTIEGGPQTDTFIVRAGDLERHDEILDFEPGIDVIEVDMPGVDSLADLGFRQLDNGVRVFFGQNGSMDLKGGLVIDQVRDARNFDFV